MRRLPTWALCVVLTGVGAGLGAIALTVLLHLVEHAAYGSSGTSAVGAERASPLRRWAAVTGAGAVVGTGWWALRRWGPRLRPLTEAVRDPRPGTRPLATGLDAVLQVVAVGAGASLGREGAPRQVGAMVASWLADRTGLDGRRRAVLLACGAGAGLGAVYDVPLGGALFAAEVLLASTAVGDVVAAVVTSATATAVAEVVLGGRPTYVVHAPPFTAAVLVASLVLVPLAAAVGLGFTAVTSWARGRVARGWQLPVAVVVVFAALGVAAGPLPQLLGNGQSLAQLAFSGSLSLPLLALLLVVKPLATAACLRSGAVGGLLTPSLATGAVLGVLVGVGVAHLAVVPGAGRPPVVLGCALVGAAAVLACTQGAPLTAVVLVLELTHAGQALLVPLLVGVGGATALSTWVRGRWTSSGRTGGVAPSADDGATTSPR